MLLATYHLPLTAYHLLLTTYYYLPPTTRTKLLELVRLAGFLALGICYIMSSALSLHPAHLPRSAKTQADILLLGFIWFVRTVSYQSYRFRWQLGTRQKVLKKKEWDAISIIVVTFVVVTVGLSRFLALSLPPSFALSLYTWCLTKLQSLKPLPPRAATAATVLTVDILGCSVAISGPLAAPLRRAGSQLHSLGDTPLTTIEHLL